MTIDEMRIDIARKNKRGISFILSSVLIWIVVLIIWRLPIDNILTKNFLTFCATAPLMPLAYAFSKIVNAQFSVKDNPLNNLGILFSMNQFLYILIAMWAYGAAPSKMVMIIAMIFGAHLLPFAWLYKSKAYMIMSVVIPILILIIGYNLKAESVFIIPATMILIEIIFVAWLAIEIKNKSI